MTNLLANPSFEGIYTARGAGEVQVAPEWNPWYSEGWHEIPGIEGGSAYTIPTARPEYKPLPRSLDAYRVRSGDVAQCWFSFSRVNYAGIYQQVPVAVGKWYQFAVWAQAWSSNDEADPHTSPGELYISLGIDPDGNGWWKSRSIAWCQWQPVTNAYRQFISIPVVAQKSTVSVWIASGVKWALRHGDIYVDDASLVEFGMVPTPEPEPEPEPQPGEPINYDYITQIVRAELANREPVRWPR
jgi:hypothetical protein